MLLGMYLGLCFGDRPDLLAKAMPDYPPAAKRILRDNGEWASTLKRDNVQLLTDPIAAIEPSGLRMVDGTTHDVDVIIYGTGFQASRFLTPMQVTGRGGIDLHEQWDGNARAYLGIVTPNFPNFFMLYGPNTNIVVNGSIIYFSECEVHYVLQCLHHIPHHQGAGHRLPRGRARSLQRAHRRGQSVHGMGRLERQQLVQERLGTCRPELAVQPAGVLAADPRSQQRRLRAAVTAHVTDVGPTQVIGVSGG